MKRKVSVRLSPHLFERLQAAAESQASTKTAIFEAALEGFLSPKPKCDEENKLLRRFESMGHQLEQIERDLGISHNSVLTTLQHICDGEKVWLECLRTTAEGDSWRLPQGEAPKLPFIELQRQWPELWKGYRGWLAGVEEAALAIEVVVQLPGDAEPSLPRWKILRHVLDHSQFHRGQIVGMIRALGVCPPAINRMDSYFAAELIAV